MTFSAVISCGNDAEVFEISSFASFTKPRKVQHSADSVETTDSVDAADSVADSGGGEVNEWEVFLKQIDTADSDGGEVNELCEEAVLWAVEDTKYVFKTMRKPYQIQIFGSGCLLVNMSFPEDLTSVTSDLHEHIERSLSCRPWAEI